jgi:uncharacterized protein YndB with AHSA1/START domain
VTVTLARRRHVPASPDAVWAVLGDFGSLASWAPELDHTCLLREGDLDVGLARRVQMGRTTLVETVDVVEPGRRLGYRIEGLPPVLRRVRNEWTLDPAGDGTAVTVTSTVDAGPRPPQRLVARLAALRLTRASDSMLAGLAGHLAGGDDRA